MIRLSVAGMSVWSSAGNLAALQDALAERAPALDGSPPYNADGLVNPRCGRTEVPRARPAEALLEAVVAEALARSALPPTLRVGLVVGTSSGNVCGAWEAWHRAFLAGEAVEESADLGRDAPTDLVAQRHQLSPSLTLSNACISGTAVFAVAEGWLVDGVADAVVVAGLDALSQFIHAGFSGLGALTADRPRPFAPDRDGLLPGEGAAALVLVADSASAGVQLLSTGLASDGGTSMTAPDRQGRGAERAIREALARAGRTPPQVDLVSVHGTGTRFNDAMEMMALRAVFGDHRLAIHGVKHVIGHTMGAAGAIEAAVLVDAMQTGRIPPPPDVAWPDPATAEADAASGIVHYASATLDNRHLGLSMSSAFGGLNAVAVFGTGARVVVEPKPVTSGLERRGCPAAWATPPRNWHRGDAYVKAGMQAIAELVEAEGPIPETTALVLGTRTGCRITDRAYHARLVKEGAERASRRLFTYTLPGAPLCEAAIHHGLHGAQLALIGSAEQAEAEAIRWVRHGRAAVAISLWCEVPGADGPVDVRARMHRVAT